MSLSSFGARLRREPCTNLQYCSSKARGIMIRGSSLAGEGETIGLGEVMVVTAAAAMGAALGAAAVVAALVALKSAAATAVPASQAARSSITAGGSALGSVLKRPHSLVVGYIRPNRGTRRRNARR